LKTSIEKIEQHYVKLCQEIGERHLGSVGEVKAAEYLKGEFWKSGHGAELEYYDAPGWVCHDFNIIYKDSNEPLNAYPCFYSNSCNVQGVPVVIDRWEEKNIDGLNLNGKICFVTLPTEVGANVMGRNEFAELLDSKGVILAIFISNYADTYNSKIVRTPHLKQMAVICLSGEEALRLAKNADSEISVVINAEKIDHRSPNVVAKLENGKKRIVLGCHYDTAPDSPGAGDNASGTVAVLEIARLLKDRIKNYSIDFVSFSGEEYGGMNGYPIGSYMYVEQHKESLQNIEYMINLDDIGFALGNVIVYTNDNGDFKQCLVDHFDDKNILVDSDNYQKTSDDYIFHMNGVKIAFLIGTANQYLPIHSPEDTVDKMSFEKTAAVVEAVAELIVKLDTEKKD